MKEKFTDLITQRNRIVVILLLLVTAFMFAGSTLVSESSNLDQFQGESDEAEALNYIEGNFTVNENITTVQLIVRGDNVLSKESLVNLLEMEEEIRSDQNVKGTLADENAVFSISNLIATTAIRQEQVQELRVEQQKLQEKRNELNTTAKLLTDSLNRTRELQARYDSLNQSLKAGEIDRSTYEERVSALQEELENVRSNVSARLSEEQMRTFESLMDQAMLLQNRLTQLNASLAQGQINQSTYRKQALEIQNQFGQVYNGTQKVLAPDIKEIREDGEELQRKSEELKNAPQPSVEEQREKLESMNESEINAVINQVLGQQGGNGGFNPFALMPTNYEEGSTSASATMMVISQKSEVETTQGFATDEIIEAQKAIEDVGKQKADEADNEALIFGAGIISDEINKSMSDSVMIVAPLALLFVIITLIIAYRDILDIVLGITGIFVVLIWTFGFMGWAGIEFNQIFVAVPVLLIGISIDYAIHVFMRHREEMENNEDEDVFTAMNIALGSVGVALVWVTATAVIGFLSNLTSSLPPIREFGVVSAFGIFAALIIFGALIPAIKIELDALLERFGFNRRKRAFGTGGTVFSKVLSVGYLAARKTPWIVVLLTVLVTGVTLYGATNVDTSFSQEDFLAEDPPQWTKDLPEPFKPSDYSAKQNLDYVNQNFVREDTKGQVLVKGDITDPDVLKKLSQAQEQVTQARGENGNRIAVILSNGKASIQSPLRLMESVAATNESFAGTLESSDTDGDGVPDRNIEELYDSVFEIAPNQASQVIHKTDEGYVAFRMSVFVRGDAEFSDVRDAMTEASETMDTSGVEATPTGDPVVFKIVENQIFDTVIQSLLVSIIAVFLFLMITYRITDGSATLGMVTLLPVALNVAWILGSMYALDMPFNVITGTITNLTIGLGVAYNIHISERFNHELELEKHDSVWDAMHTTVTGTGGALLGSAATTIGGFGVLAFAILPALQQFGIITAITIGYAFLASVFLLPTLLIIWTKFITKEEVEEKGFLIEKIGGILGSETEKEASDETEEEPTEATEPGTTEVTTTRTDKGRVEREVSTGHPGPGEEVEVKIHVPETSGRVVLRESAGTPIKLVSVEPEPVASTQNDHEVYVAWEFDEPSEGAVEYTLRIPGGSEDGREMWFEGALESNEGTERVGGDESVMVTEDFYERIMSRDEITREEIRQSHSEFEEGRISSQELEEIHQRWLKNGRVEE